MKEIVIDNFQKGVAQSPHEGFEDMRNVDIYSEKGAVIINLDAVNKTGTAVVTGKPLWLLQSPVGTASAFFAVCDNGKVFRSPNSGISWSEIGDRDNSGNGAAIWKDYLLVATDTGMDAYGPLSGTPQWVGTAFVSSLTDDDWHTMHVAQDDILYVCNQRYVASLQETSGTAFLPTQSGTYTFTAQALDLPQDVRTRTLAELGEDLMIGTWKGENQTFANIYPWDRISSSFRLPIEIKDKGVRAMLNKDNVIYTFAGSDGACYVTDGSNTAFLSKPPKSLFQVNSSAQMEIYPGAVMSHENRIFFGLSAVNDNFTSAALGVWSISQDGILVLENETSLQSRSNTVGKVTSLVSTGRMKYLAGWEGVDPVSGTTYYAVDLIGSPLGTTFKRYTGYDAYITSPFIPLGTSSKPVSLSEIEVVLAGPLENDQGIKLYYRTGTSSSYNLIDTLDYSTYPDLSSITTTLGVTTTNGIQIKAELTTGSSASTTPRLKAIILR